MSTSPEPKKNAYLAPALDKGLDILEYLAGESTPRSQSEVAQALGRKQSEIYRMLARLEERGYIVKEDESGRYRLTLRLYQLSHRQHATARLRKAARPAMEALSEKIGQSCHLSVQHGASLLVMMEQMPTREICLSVGEGKLYPLARTASGKILLSRMTDDALLGTLKRDTEFAGLTKKARDQAHALITQARSDGHLAEPSAFTLGAIDIAAPLGVRGTDTDAVLAVSYLTSGKKGDTQCRGYLNAVKACTKEIDLALGIAP